MSATPDIPGSAATFESPWLGLRSFTEDAQSFFFGRKDEVDDLYERILDKPLTILFGQSGLGKSSLLQAALVPRLRAAGFLPVLVRFDHDPEAPPLEQQLLERLRTALDAASYARPTATLSDALAQKSAPMDFSAFLWLLFHDPALGFIPARGAPAETFPRPVFLIDQFEEMFTLGERPARRALCLKFRETLAALVENRTPSSLRAMLEGDDDLAERLDYNARHARVLLSLREDFLHLLERWRRTMPSLMENRFELRMLSGPQAFLAVVRPGQLRAGLPAIISDEVGEAIVRFVAGKKDVPLEEIDAVPPLLSLVCAELNAQRLTAGQSQVTQAQFEGSSTDILASFYLRSFDLSTFGSALESVPNAETALKNLRLIIEDELLSPDGFRENIAFDTIAHYLSRAAGAEAAKAVLEAMVERRLLTVEERGGVRRLELAHDVLTRIVKTSGDERHELEAIAKAKSEKERAEAEMVRILKERNRFKRVAVSAGVLAIVAVAAALFAVDMYRDAKDAEKQAKELKAQALAAARDSKIAEERAEKSKGQALTAFHQADHFIGVAFDQVAIDLRKLGQVDLLKPLALEASRYYESTKELGPEVTNTLGRAQMLATQGLIAESQVDNEQAANYFQQASVLADRLPSPPDQAEEILRFRVRAAYKVAANSTNTANKLRWAEQSVTLAKQLANLPGIDTRSQSEWMIAFYRLSYAMDWNTEGTNAERLARAAVKQGAEWRVQAPSNEVLAQAYTAALWGLAKIQKALTNIDAAENSLRECMALDQALVDEHPLNLSARNGLSITLGTLADVLLDRGKRDEALDLYRRRFAIDEQLMSMNPDNADWQGEWDSANEDLQEFLRTDTGDNKSATAEELWRLALRRIRSAEEVRSRFPHSSGLATRLPTAHQFFLDVVRSLFDRYDATGWPTNAAELAHQAMQSADFLLAPPDLEKTHNWRDYLAYGYAFAGKYAMNKGHYVEARTNFMRALEMTALAPEVPRCLFEYSPDAAYTAIGNACLGETNTHEAALWFKKAAADGIVVSWLDYLDRQPWSAAVQIQREDALRSCDDFGAIAVSVPFDWGVRKFPITIFFANQYSDGHSQREEFKRLSAWVEERGGSLSAEGKNATDEVFKLDNLAQKSRVSLRDFYFWSKAAKEIQDRIKPSAIKTIQEELKEAVGPLAAIPPGQETTALEPALTRLIALHQEDTAVRSALGENSKLQWGEVGALTQVLLALRGPALWPKDKLAAAYGNLAFCSLLKDNTNAALQWARMAVDLAPENPGLRSRLALSLWSQNRKQQALLLLTNASWGDDQDEFAKAAVQDFESLQNDGVMSDLNRIYLIAKENKVSFSDLMDYVVQGEKSKKSGEEDTPEKKLEVALARVKAAEESYTESKNDENRLILAARYGSAGWHALFLRRWGESENYSRKALALDPKDTVAEGNLATALLFQNKYEQALQIYRAHWNEPHDDTTFGYATLQDFEDLDAAGITHPDCARIRAEFPPGKTVAGYPSKAPK